MPAPERLGASFRCLYGTGRMGVERLCLFVMAGLSLGDDPDCGCKEDYTVLLKSNTAPIKGLGFTEFLIILKNTASTEQTARLMYRLTYCFIAAAGGT